MADNTRESLERQLEAYGSMAGRRAPECAARHDCAERQDKSSPGWIRFAAAAGTSLVSAASADAAINHVMPATPIRVNFPTTSDFNFNAFDLNNDAANDAQLGAGVSYSTYLQGFRLTASVQGFGGLTFLPDPANTQNVKRVAQNEVIPAVAPTATPALLRSSVSTYSYAAPESLANGNWGKADTGLAGFVFGPAGSKRAGWIQIRTRSAFNGHATRLTAIEVLQWAFETVPGVSIMAGQTAGAIPGDYNSNGSVGPEDYTVWKNTFNNNVTAGTGADGNSNGKVDAADYTFWRDRTSSAGSGATAAAVPEPTSVTLGVLALGAAGIASLRRRAS